MNHETPHPGLRAQAETARRITSLLADGLRYATRPQPDWERVGRLAAVVLEVLKREGTDLEGAYAVLLSMQDGVLCDVCGR